MPIIHYHCDNIDNDDNNGDLYYDNCNRIVINIIVIDIVIILSIITIIIIALMIIILIII